jgi:hypothetical protein
MKASKATAFHDDMATLNSIDASVRPHGREGCSGRCGMLTLDRGLQLLAMSQFTTSLTEMSITEVLRLRATKAPSTRCPVRTVPLSTPLNTRVVTTGRKPNIRSYAPVKGLLHDSGNLLVTAAPVPRHDNPQATSFHVTNEQLFEHSRDSVSSTSPGTIMHRSRNLITATSEAPILPHGLKTYDYNKEASAPPCSKNGLPTQRGDRTNPPGRETPISTIGTDIAQPSQETRQGPLSITSAIAGLTISTQPKSPKQISSPVWDSKKRDEGLTSWNSYPIEHYEIIEDRPAALTQPPENPTGEDTDNEKESCLPRRSSRNSPQSRRSSASHPQEDTTWASDSESDIQASDQLATFDILEGQPVALMLLTENPTGEDADDEEESRLP